MQALHQRWRAHTPPLHQAVADAALEAGWRLDVRPDDGWSLAFDARGLDVRVVGDGRAVVSRWVSIAGWSSLVALQTLAPDAALAPARWRQAAAL